MLAEHDPRILFPENAIGVLGILGVVCTLFLEAVLGAVLGKVLWRVLGEVLGWFVGRFWGTGVGRVCVAVLWNGFGTVRGEVLGRQFVNIKWRLIFEMLAKFVFL